MIAAPLVPWSDGIRIAMEAMPRLPKRTMGIAYETGFVDQVDLHLTVGTRLTGVGTGKRHEFRISTRCSPAEFHVACRKAWQTLIGKHLERQQARYRAETRYAV